MNVRFHKSVAIAFLIFSLLGNLPVLLLGYLAVFIHEMAHLVACICNGVKIEEICFSIWGMNLKIKNTTDTKKFLGVWIAGPLMSFFVFAVFFLFESYCFFMFANFCIGVVNLLPILPLDGGMLLKFFLSSNLGIMRAGRIIRKTSSFFCLMGIFAMLFCLATGIFNISFFIFIPMLIAGQRKSKSLFLRDKQRVLSGEIECRNKFKYIATDSSSELLAVAELISPSHKLFVAVFDGGKFLGAMTQEEIISAIMKKGALARLKECSFS